MPKGTRSDLLQGLSKGNWSDAMWVAFMSPPRIELLLMIEALGEATAAQLSDGSGRSADSLYPHLGVLESSGFISSEERSDEGRPARVYSLTEAASVRPVDHAEGSGMRRLALAVEVQLRDAARRIKRCADLAEDERRSPGDLQVTTDLVWVDAERRERFTHLLSELRALVRESRRDRIGERMFLGIQFFPDVSLKEHRLGKSDRSGGRDGRGPKDD
jgi:predicted ArsR family transcriptional regulator